MRDLLGTTRRLLLAGVFAGASAFGAAAGPVTVDGGWVTITFGGVGSGFSGEPYTFTLASAGTLTVTDAYLSGDQFEIFDNLVSIGLTSLPGSTGDQVGSDFDAALADSRWSSAVFTLSAGTYSITGVVLTSPFNGGDGGLRVDTTAAVPEPMSLAILGMGLFGLGLARRRA